MIEKLMDKLILAQENYIKLLGDYISKNTSYLIVHNMGASQEDIEKGIELRKLIANITEDIRKEINK